jgi:hypothetical protein
LREKKYIMPEERELWFVKQNADPFVLYKQTLAETEDVSGKISANATGEEGGKDRNKVRVNGEMLRRNCRKEEGI